jgi:branched-chain amino acid transport system permease protein
MGDRAVIYGFVVAFLAGVTRSPLRALTVGVLLGVVEQCASMWLSAQWTQNTVFAILVGYLVVLSTAGRRPRLRLRRPLEGGTP